MWNVSQKNIFALFENWRKNISEGQRIRLLFASIHLFQPSLLSQGMNLTEAEWILYM